MPTLSRLRRLYKGDPESELFLFLSSIGDRQCQLCPVYGGFGDPELEFLLFLSSIGAPECQLCPVYGGYTTGTPELELLLFLSSIGDRECQLCPVYEGYTTGNPNWSCFCPCVSADRFLRYGQGSTVQTIHTPASLPCPQISETDIY